MSFLRHIMRKQGSCLEKEVMQGTMPGASRRGRQRMACMDNIKTWTGLSVEESTRMTDDRDKWSKYVYISNYSSTSPFSQCADKLLLFIFAVLVV